MCLTPFINDTTPNTDPAPADLFELARADPATVTKLRMVFSRVLNPAAPSLIQNLHVDPHAVAQLLVTYFRELPAPVFPARYFYTFLRVNDIATPRTRATQLRVLLYKQPAPARAVTLALGRYLRECLLSPTAYASLLAPCFFRAPEGAVPSALDSERTAATLARIFTDLVKQHDYLAKTAKEPLCSATVDVDDVPPPPPPLPSSSLASQPGDYTLEAVALYDFAGGPYLLPLRKGERVRLLDIKTEPGWLQAASSTAIGYVPEAYVDIVPVPAPVPALAPVPPPPAIPPPPAVLPPPAAGPAGSCHVRSASSCSSSPGTPAPVPPPPALPSPVLVQRSRSPSPVPSPLLRSCPPSGTRSWEPSPPPPPVSQQQPGPPAVSLQTSPQVRSTSPLLPRNAAGAPPTRSRFSSQRRNTVMLCSGSTSRSPFSLQQQQQLQSTSTAGTLITGDGNSSSQSKGAWKQGLSAEELAGLPKLMQARATRATEILTSERTYLDFLRTMTRLFVTPMKAYPMGLTHDEFLSIFSNVEVLEKCHTDLLGTIEQRLARWDDDTTIGDVFLTETGFIKLYRYYVNNYENSLVVLAQCRKKSAEFDAYLKKWELTPEMRNSQLTAFLVAPVQRVMRYSMLLEEVLKKTPRAHPDAEPLRRAVAMMKSMAEYINEKKRDVENTAAFEALRARIKHLPADIVADPKRTLLREGGAALNTPSAHVYVFLFSDLLLVTKPPKHDRYSFKTAVDLTACSVTRDDPSGGAAEGGSQSTSATSSRSFRIEPHGQEPFTLIFGTEGDAQEWFSTVFAAVQDKKDIAILSHNSSVRAALDEDSLFKHRSAAERQAKQHERLAALLAAEDAFGTRLARLTAVFIAPLRASASSPAPILRADRVGALAAGPEALAGPQTRFHAALAARLAEWDRTPALADIAGTELLAYATAFVQYLRAFRGACAALDDAARVPAYQFWIVRTETDTKLSLDAELAAPLLRFPDLFFALQEVALCAGKDNPDTPALAAAMAKVKAAKDEFVLLATSLKALPPVAASLSKFSVP